jgi:Putative Actinobacterial Holin-X, holin superfamily III
MGDSTRRDGPMVGASNRPPDDMVRHRGDASAFKFDRRPESGRDNNESIPELLRDLVSQGGQLAEQQTKLVQAEVRTAAKEMTAAVGAMAGAGVVAIAALGVFLMGLSFLLGRVMPLWAATLIVAVATMVVAYAMFAAGKRKIAHNDSLSMDRTRHTMERAPHAIAGNRNEGQNHGR